MKKYRPHFLDGIGRTKSFRHKQRVIHLVEPTRGDNFKKALCGKEPSAKSLGWNETNNEVTCKKCKRLFNE